MLFAATALSLPPLYLALSTAGVRVSLRSVALQFARALEAVGIVLGGLGVPAAWFSVTLRSSLTDVVWAAALLSAGTAWAVMAAWPHLAHGGLRPRVVGVVWIVFAGALGERLLGVLLSH